MSNINGVRALLQRDCSVDDEKQNENYRPDKEKGDPSSHAADGKPYILVEVEQSWCCLANYGAPLKATDCSGILYPDCL